MFLCQAVPIDSSVFLCKTIGWPPYCSKLIGKFLVNVSGSQERGKFFEQARKLEVSKSVDVSFADSQFSIGYYLVQILHVKLEIEPFAKLQRCICVVQ